MKEQQDLTKMEFLLTLNDRIVVQRFYNVRDYNSRAKNSYDLYEYVRWVKDVLENDLKTRTVNYMIDNKEQIFEDDSVLKTSMTDGPENFNIYIKTNDVTICHRQFDAKLYPPKVRYTVDVRPHLKEILRGLTDIFSAEDLSYEYLGLPLEV
jgi:hypothetical protein